MMMETNFFLINYLNKDSRPVWWRTLTQSILLFYLNLSETGAVPPPTVDNSQELIDTKEALAEAERKLTEAEAEQTADAEAHAKQIHKLEKKLKAATNNVDELTEQKRGVESELKIVTESAQEEMKLKQDQLDQGKCQLLKY